jgi:hypothetical protein
MKSALLCVVVLAASAAANARQVPMAKAAIMSEEDYSRAMKDIGQQNNALRKAIGATPNDVDAAAAAQRLEVIFKDVQNYWEHRKVEDAAVAAKEAVAASQGISKAVAAHDMAAANTLAATLGQQCMSCHTAHRDRQPDGSFKMK